MSVVRYGTYILTTYIIIILPSGSVRMKAESSCVFRVPVDFSYCLHFPAMFIYSLDIFVLLAVGH